MAEGPYKAVGRLVVKRSVPSPDGSSFTLGFAIATVGENVEDPTGAAAAIAGALNAVHALFPPLEKRADGHGYNDDSADVNLDAALTDMTERGADPTVARTVGRVLDQLKEARRYVEGD